MAAPVLHLADDLVLDLGAYASTGWRAGVWASSGRGKSYAVGVIVEELLDAHIPVVVIDPEGEFWTLREGYRTVVVGGPRGDLPLCGACPAVREILEVALGQDLALVVDLSDLAANAAQQEAARPFLEELFVLLGRERRTAGVVVEEAHVFAPQFGSASTAEIMSRLAKQGRKRGVLLVAASQRTQAVSKEFMSQLNFPMLGGFDEKLDFDAVKHHAAGWTFRELNGLPVGMFWFPRLGEFHRIRARRVTHGGDTPDLGGEVVLRGVVADGDLEAVVARLAEAVGRARAEEEAERGEVARLRRRVEELEAELAEKAREVERLQVALRVAAAQAAAKPRPGPEARVNSVSVRANRVEVAAGAPALVQAVPATPAVPVTIPAGGVALLEHPAVQGLLQSACSLTRKHLGGYEEYCVAALEALARSRAVSPSELAVALGLGSSSSVSRVRVACRQLARVGLAKEQVGGTFTLHRENLEKAVALAEARMARRKKR